MSMSLFQKQRSEGRKTFVILLSTALFLSSASAREWHINPETGNDESNGTKDTPLATAQIAANRAEPGDIIHLHPENALYRQSITLNKGQTRLTIEGNGVTLTGADPLKVAWESLGGNLQRTRLPIPRWGRHLLVVNGKKVHMARRSVHPKDFPPAEELKDGEFRWDDIDDKEGWLTLKGSTKNLEWAIRPNGIGTGGDLSGIAVRNLNARHFLNDGFNIHGNARNLLFENITGYENFDEGFSAHDTCEAWIKDSKFWKNENAIADVNMADTYYENCEFSDSDSVEVLLFGGRHVLMDCRILPTKTSTAIDIRRGGHPKRKGLISEGNVTFLETTITREDPKISYGPNTAVFHDEKSRGWLKSVNLRQHSSNFSSESTFAPIEIGRHDDGQAIVASFNGITSFDTAVRWRLLTFVPLDYNKHPAWDSIISMDTPIPKVEFPPTGPAYESSKATAHSLWRLFIKYKPDLVVFPPDQRGGELHKAIENSFNIVFREPNSPLEEITRMRSDLPLEERNAVMRSPETVATQLSENYGKKFSGSYIEALALISHLRLGNEDAVKSIAANFLKNAELPKNGGSIAGSLLFSRLDDDASRQRVIDVANMAFDKEGNPLEAMPTHSEMSDAVFMACPILAEAGRITGEKKYFDQCLAHFRFIRNHCLRDDGIYRHSPLDEAAWGRGNGFPALGLAMVLEAYPEDHPGRAEILTEFQNHMNALAPYQDLTGMWHQVIDHPESYAEFTSSCMISYAALRGFQNGWLEEKEWEPRVWRAWSGIKSRIGADGVTLIDVCTGTGKQKSLEDYFNRKAILGRDDRGGAMALLFSTEMMSWLGEE